jgi:heme-degrading monooxygenase HmoA
MKSLLNSIVASVLLGTLSYGASPAPAAESPAYELRIYTTNEGKLPDLLKRFRQHTCKIFEKHGITNIGYWVPIEKADGADNMLVYIISHASREAAKANWAAFEADPEWKEAQKASEANGKILAKKPESIFMTLAEFSMEPKLGPGAEPRVFELRTYHAPEGKLADLHARFKHHTIELFNKHGITSIAYWRPMDADKGHDNTLIYIIAHPSKETGLKNWGEFMKDPDWMKAKSESEKDGPLTLAGKQGVKSVFMQATDFSPIK